MFKFIEIEEVESFSKEDFLNQHFKNQRPLVVRKMTREWPAYQKWNFDYLKNEAGENWVPLYDNSPVDANEKYNEPKTKMKLGEYIDLLLKGPTDLRLFLYNLVKEVPQFQKDFTFPNVGLKLMKGFPMLFIGGEGAYVFMHYDIDLANIFHFHFAGIKECILVSPEQTKYMYKIPNSTICREDINFENPDFDKWPALKNLTPYRCKLHHGDMLYIPEGWWHYMKYDTPGFSMSLRSIAKKPKYFAQAVYNVFFMRYYDNLMRKLKGQSWIEQKNEKAITLTHRTLIKENKT